jgi:hypothetical protein
MDILNLEKITFDDNGDSDQHVLTLLLYHSDLTQKDGQWANGGPYRAVVDISSQFWEFSTLPYNNGLTLLRKKYSNRYFQ